MKNKLPIIGLILLVLLWELNSQFLSPYFFSKTLPKSLFPSLSNIGSNMLKLLQSDQTFINIGYTLLKTIGAFCISSLFGIIAGTVCGKYRHVNDILLIPIELFRNLPAIALLPIFMIFFGLGSGLSVAISTTAAFFPVYLATRFAYNNINSSILLTIKYYHWKGMKLYLHIILPSMLPKIASSMLVAMSLSLVLSVIVEMMVGSHGIGAMIVLTQRTFNYPELYCWMFILGVSGFVLSQTLNTMIAKFIFWKT